MLSSVSSIAVVNVTCDATLVATRRGVYTVSGVSGFFVVRGINLGGGGGAKKV